jgi:hypothetical protein
MPVFEVSEDLCGHPAVNLLRRSDSLGIWTRMGAWSARARTKGAVPDYVLHAIGGTRAVIDDLLRVQLLEQVDEHEYRLGHGVYGLRPLWRIRGTTHRTPILPSVRTTIYRRDGYRCVECGSTDDLTLDHIHPWSRGGSDHPSNLRTLCRSCNSRKGARPL